MRSGFKTSRPGEEKRMKSSRVGSIRIFWLSLFIAASLFPVSIQAEVEAEAGAIIARYVKQIGGREAILKQKFLKWQGDMDFRKEGLAGKVELSAAFPDKQVSIVNLDLYGRMVTGFNGMTGWKVEPGLRFRFLQDQELQDVRDESELNSELHDSSQFKSVRFTGTNEFRETKCFALELTRRSGRKQLEFYDAKTDLLIGIQSTKSDGETWALSSYKSFDGVKIATKRDLYRNNMLELSITITSVTHSEIEEAVFDYHRYQPPAAVRGLPNLSKNSPGAPDKTDRSILAKMEQWSVPGMAVAVFRKGKIVKADGYGFADVEQRIPVLPETCFPIASMTKSFTAIGVMILVQERRIRLEDSVKVFFNDVPKSWEAITVERLLNHSSGLPQQPYQWSALKNYTRESIFEAIRTSPLEYAPGERATYSNAGYHLLGLILSQVTGESFENFIRQRILEKSGMRQTYFFDGPIPCRTKGYIVTPDGELIAAFHKSVENGGAAGGMVSNVIDIGKWDSALSAGEILDSATLERMETPLPQANGTYSESTLGWFIATRGGYRVVGHGGDSGTGFQTRISRFVKKQTTIVVLSNGQLCDPLWVVSELAARYVPGYRR